tara:strand:+ start:212 stop:754 length:543 start_codon:yes stop_codon:yes gene_type:complete
MKILRLLKSIPFLLTLTILIILNINNQKENTKLKLLLWNSPSLSLGTYITISAGTGYLLSYVFTTTLSKDNKLKSIKGLRYKSSNLNIEDNFYQQPFNEINYDNTLIERDIKDPSPTLDASFRVIGKKNTNQDLSDNDLINEYNSPYNIKDAYPNDYGYDNNNELNEMSNDWDEDNFTNW